MEFYVVDTNVPVVANGRSIQADVDCVAACLDALVAVREQGILLLDDGLRILDEYLRNLSLSGQPGPGDLFMKWIWERQANEQHCRLVPITPVEGEGDDFVEFPADPRLAGFDRSDRKFVAVAVSSGLSPEILNAVDTDWAEHYPALRDASLEIRFLCPHHVSPGRD